MAKMKLKTKGIIKKIAFALAGVAALTAVGFGVKAIVDYTKNDLKTISPSFEVGNLGSDGKYVNDESTLYTKEAFACDGLQIKPDFDNEINYQIFYYDDLDNFIESTAVLSEAYSVGIHDSYARLVIIPTNDEDEKISFTEKFTYPKQMEIKVSKNQSSYYADFFGKQFRFVNDASLLRFVKGDFVYQNGKIAWNVGAKHSCCTSKDLLCVSGGEKIEFNWANTSDKIGICRITQIKKTASGYTVTDYDKELVTSRGEKNVITLNKDTDFVMFKFYFVDSAGTSLTTELSDSVLVSVAGGITVKK